MNQSCTPEYLLLTGANVPPSDPIRLANGRVVSLISLFLNFSPAAITKEVLEEVASEYGLPRERAYAECLAAALDVGSDRTERDFVGNYLVPMIHELDPAAFEDDPYYKEIRIPEGKCGKWEFRQMELQPCEAFVCNDFTVTKNGRLIPQLGYFLRSYRYPAVLENGREWMTLMPNETVTTLPAVEQAHGKVVTYGLGLGYFIYHTICKENVSSVTVVEKSPDVISLFKEHLLPQFPHRDKVRIVCDDAFAYAQNTAPGEKYDFAFADIWHDVGDGKELYLRFKELESISPGTQYAYWLENSIRCYLAKELWPRL